MNYFDSIQWGKDHPHYWECRKCGKVIKCNGDEFPSMGMCYDCNEDFDKKMKLEQSELKGKYLKQELNT